MLPTKFVTAREIAEPIVTILTIYEFSELKKMFLSSFYLFRLSGN